MFVASQNRGLNGYAKVSGFSKKTEIQKGEPLEAILVTTELPVMCDIGVKRQRGVL